MEWAELAVKTTTAATDAVSEILLQNGSAGTAIEDKNDLLEHDEHADWDYIDAALYERFGEDVVVRGYLPHDERLFDCIAAIRQRLFDLKALDEEGFDVGSLELAVTTVNERDWANEWKKYYKPVRASKRLVIVPFWEHYEKGEGDVVITMDPGMAFGTGTHETTRMCLEMVDEYVAAGDSVIDIGCGTAILAIAAAKLGATDVLAIDRDPVAVSAARENIGLNGVNVRAVEGDLLANRIPASADVILVNIIADVIIKLVPNLRPFLKQGGVVCTSGIIKDREQDVKDAMEQAGYSVLEVKRQGEWCAVACR